MPIETISPRRLYQQVADQLLALIDRGEFPVGSRLPTERELAAKLGVSRPTVREALIALEVHGRVRIRVGSGIYVLAHHGGGEDATGAVPVAGPFEILEARALIEGALAERAAGLATPADLAALDETLDAMSDRTCASADLLALDRRFHTTVAGILRNDALIAVVGDLFDQRMNPYFAQLAGYFENAGTWRAACAEHRAVRDMIAAGDGRGARLAMQAHLARSQERFTDNFKTHTVIERTGSAPRQSKTPARRIAAG
jgi:DNA-binding FadR family transcriptional regulator